MTDRQNILTGTVWEDRIGFSRAVRVGNLVFVSGTIAADESGNILHVGSAFDQALAAFAKGERAMLRAGASRKDVVRTRMYLTRIEDVEAVGRAHKAFFGDVMPVATMVQVTAFVAKEALVEVEMDGVVGGGS